MSNPGFRLEDLHEAVRLVEEHGKVAYAAKASGIPDATLRKRYNEAIRRGIDQAIVHPAPHGHEVKGVSTLYNPEGQVIAQWVKTRVGPLPIDQIAAVISDALNAYNPPPPVPAPEGVDTSLATVYPLADWHIGLLAWHKETGEDWDLTIAAETLKAAYLKLVSRSPASACGVVLGLGDLLHADNYENLTARSRNKLDVDGRWPKVLRIATDLVIYTIDLALQKHERVIVRLLPGNHDDQSAIAVTLALAKFYSSNPRVTVDDDAGRFWWWRWGKCFLGAAHGDMAKMKELPLIMAGRYPEEWGATKHRLILTGHVHHRQALNAKEFAGVEVESFSSPAAKDAWQTASGFVSGRSVHAITFDQEHGELHRSRQPIITPKGQLA